jgi:hypothetical protein
VHKDIDDGTENDQTDPGLIKWKITRKPTLTTLFWILTPCRIVSWQTAVSTLVILIGHIPCNLLTSVTEPIPISLSLYCLCGHNSTTLKMVAAHSSETFCQLIIQCNIKTQNTISWSTYTMKAQKRMVRLWEGVTKEKMHNVNGYSALVLSHTATVGNRTEQISRVIISYI